MNISEALETLHNLTKARIVKADIARALGVDPAALRRKEVAGIELKPNEIAKIESYFRLKLVKPKYYTDERQNDLSIYEKIKKFGDRLSNLQDKHEYLDKDMAKLLSISEDDYIDLKTGDVSPDINILNRLKQCFNVSIDYLLYGE